MCQGIFLLWHVFCWHLGRARRRVKTDTCRALFLRKWGRFRRHREFHWSLKVSPCILWIIAAGYPAVHALPGIHALFLDHFL